MPEEKNNGTGSGQKQSAAVPRNRGFYILPNLFTSAGLFAGFYSIVMAMSGRFEQAALAIFIAMVCDSMDGRVARLTHTQSDFGVQYDSLSDMVSFGVAPALVMYVWALQGLGKLGWGAAFTYAACAALRLARFNVQAEVADKRFFTGLPSPAAAGLVASLVWIMNDVEVAGPSISWYACGLTFFAGITMVTNIRFYSFKAIDFRKSGPFAVILAPLAVIVLVTSYPPLVLFTVFGLYALSGYAFSLYCFYKKRRQLRSTSA